MMNMPLREWAAAMPIRAAAAAIAIIGAATIAGAWFFQLGLGLQPCPLCLEQRIPYYAAVPIAALTAIGAERRWPRRMLVAALAIAGLLMLWGAGLAAYHAGVEWHWWPGPQDCSGAGFSAGGGGGNLLQQMQSARVVRCDAAAWTFLGLSLAGYNALISLALTALAAWGIMSRGGAAMPPYGSSSVSQ
jgi:disulfide bond formation protein DsbB